MSELVVRSLSKTFPGKPDVRALVDVDLDVASGTLLAILGPSGCGKTTLLRIIAGFDQPDDGTVTLGDRQVSSPTTSVPPHRRQVGIVPQEGGLFPHLDVHANIAFGLRDLDRSARRRRVAELLELVDLADLGARRPHELSGGQQQRVALARALAPDPQMIMLDEPFAALDTSLRSTLRDDVKDVLARAGTTAIIVTHDQTEALAMADTVAVMRAGRVVQVDEPTAIYERPVDLATAGLIGECNLVDGVSDGPTVRTSLGRLVLARPAEPGARLRVLIRPEQIVPSVDGAGTIVTAASYEGATVRVHLRLDHAELIARWPSTDVPTAGTVRAVHIVGAVMGYDVC
ncbi:MAG: ABC transporter ATP-binding protein [Ilumatobacteraceae bacterium]